MVASTATLNLSYNNNLPTALSRRTAIVINQRPPLTEEDIRIHTWINDRLAAIHKERNSLRASVASFLFGDRLN